MRKKEKLEHKEIVCYKELKNQKYLFLLLKCLTIRYSQFQNPIIKNRLELLPNQA